MGTKNSFYKQETLYYKYKIAIVNRLSLFDILKFILQLT